ncbi:MAG TPA: glycosyltransferase family 39 protein [Pyrinomonadaceae bacterium]|nr:glycosyltransferase family 39 protein [Pyrinomonadaceae bacterium]
MNALLALLSLALCLAIAFLAEGGAAAVVFCVAVASIAGALLHRVREHRVFFLRIFVGGLLVRAGVGTLIYFFELQEFFGGDALGYDWTGSALMEGWQSRYGMSAVTRAWVNADSGWGMVYLVAIIYSVVGRNMLAVQLFNAVIGAATAPLIFLCAQHIFRSLRVAHLSAFFVAFYPSLVLWSSQGLKDGPIVFVLAVGMLATLKLGERLSVKYLITLVLSLAAILSLRFYIFFMMVAAIGGSLAIGMRQLTSQSLARQLAVVLVGGLCLTYMGVLSRAGAQLETYGTLERIQVSRSDLATSANSGFGRDVDVSTTSGALSAIPMGMTYLLFAPFPWQLASLRQSITLPEMIVWWASFPLLVLGLWFTVKYRLRAAMPVLIFTGMLTLAYSVFQGNVGTAYRQRAQLLVFYFIFVAVGYVLLKERREDEKRKQELARRAVTESARAVQAGRRAAAETRLAREKEWAHAARGLSEKVDS